MPEPSKYALADEVEVAALVSPSKRFSIEELKVRLRQEGVSELDPSTEMGDDEKAALLAADASSELGRRQSLLDFNYPFTFDGDILSVSDGSKVFYLSLLLMTLEFGEGHSGRRLFEEVVARALAGYLGGDHVRFGWPRKAPVPRNTEEALTYLAEQIVEDRSHGRAIRPSVDKDMGLDAVAWKHFPDRRRGKVVIFGQCATGVHWKEKLGDLNLERWRQFVNWGVQPVRVFAVPWVVEEEDWLDIQSYGQMVFDRLRIAISLAGVTPMPELLRWYKQRERQIET